jgi:hypothetical protein
VRQGERDVRPSVAAGRDKSLVTKHLGHQLGEEIAIIVNCPGDRVRKASAWNGRYDHIKRGVWIAAIFRRVGETLNDLMVAIERVRKAVDQQQRCGGGTLAALVDEVDVDAVDIRFELRKTIAGRLVFSPVLALLPVVGQLSQIPPIDPVGPAIVLGRLDPAGAGKTAPQIVKVGLGNGDREWVDGHGSSPFQYCYEGCVYAKKRIQRAGSGRPA